MNFYRVVYERRTAEIVRTKGGRRVAVWSPLSNRPRPPRRAPAAGRRGEGVEVSARGGATPFTTVGVFASLTSPLAEAGIGLFAISTFDTDYLLVKVADVDAAVDALRRHGHTVA